MRALFAVLLIAVLALASCESREIPLNKPKPRILGNQLIFIAQGGPDCLSDVFAANADGTGFHQLTTDSTWDTPPRWSPDGTKFAFVHNYSLTADSSSVTIMDTDGTDPTRIRVLQPTANAPQGVAWSLDGLTLSFRDYSGNLWGVNPDGSNPRVLIPLDSLGGVALLTWASQTTLIGSDAFGLIRINADGANRTRFLTINNLGFAYPRISPDGSKVVFNWKGPNAGGYPENIYVVNADGSGLQQLTDGITSSSHAVWSPDGTKIAYTGSDQRAWIMNADGSDQHLVPLPNDCGAQGSALMGDWK